MGNLGLAGLRALEDYIALHVITCLVPAFLLAGAMVTFINRSAVLQFLGERVSRWRTYPLAALSSFLIAACSCTVIPVASGLYYAGAGVGVAFIILWVAPASNVLALVYTGQILGASFVLYRLIAALLIAVVVGWVMTFFFKRDKEPLPAAPTEKGKLSIIEMRHLILIALVVVSLLAPNYIVQKGPYWQKVGVWAGITIIVIIYALIKISRDELTRWLQETWWFVRLIFPLLLLGVFIVGVIGSLLPREWIERWLGGHSLRASFLATLIGAISYFATMTEAPFVDTLMKSGMGSGPALTLLLTGPGISLPNWLAVARVFGFKKALVYIPTIIVLGTLVGWIFGLFIMR